MPNSTKYLCRVRTVSIFTSLSSDIKQWRQVLEKAALICRKVSERLFADGYTVQTIRIITNPFGEYLNTANIDTARSSLATLQQLIESLPMPDGLRIRFAIGEAKNTHEIQLLPELIAEFGDLCNACVNIPMREDFVLDSALIDESSKAVKKISEITPRGEGNFNFTVNFNCEPLIPYFPAAYFDSNSEPCFVIGLETPDLLVHALENYHQENGVSSSHQYFADYFSVMHKVLQSHIARIAALVGELNEKLECNFAGFDSSAAPSKNCASMAEVYKAMGVEYFGASGTVEASALLTRVFKSIEDVNLVGFSGLMLALTEDVGLAEGSKKQQFDIRSLLTYSAVCGIGLDTVPIPGSTPTEKISALMRDTGTMAFRLNKPLTVRLFPVPNLRAGDITTFESDDLCNCAVLAVP